MRELQSLEEILKEKEKINEQSKNKRIGLNPRYKSDKGASLEDFISMINNLVTNGLRDYNLAFYSEEAYPINVEEKINNPCMTYNIVERKSSKEIKPRVREIVDKENKQGEVYGQVFECIIQFNIFSPITNEAGAIMNDFEDLIFKYTSYLKKNGIKEIVFKKHFTDFTYDPGRETMSIRNLQYYVEIEKLTVIFKEEIEEINLFD